MASVQQRVSKVVKQLEKAVAAYVKSEGLDKKLCAYPPAAPGTIAKVEEHLGLTLPASYRAFLELHNGYDYLAYPGHMLPVEAHMPGNRWYNRIVDWKRMTAKYGSAEVIDGIFVAYLESPNNWAFLDPNQPSDDNEFTVIKWLNADIVEYKDIVEFLENRLAMAK